MSFSRKRTLLSLAKLHLVTEEKLGPDPEVVQAELEAVEVELALLMHQEQLPAAVLQAYDLDPNTMRVLTALELIEVLFDVNYHSILVLLLRLEFFFFNFFPN